MPSVQVIQSIDNPGDTLWSNLLQAGVAVGIGLLVWLIVHYMIRGVVKHAMADRTPLSGRSMRWAGPMLRGIDPVIRALDHERRVQRARTIGSLLNSILTAVVAVVAVFYVLLAFDVDISPLLASVGVLGIAIGFGAQQLIRDFLAGIFITIEDQYGIGDVIETSEVVGTVEYLGLRITRVVAEDGTLWFLRNGEILRLGNRSKGSYRAPAEPPADAAADATSQAAAQAPAPIEPTESAD
ncbi:mechanosensitive ion channel family protein [Specibacter sp. AOP5-B1-6]|uniref:mechanosensitive ion channel family protein n=1 Tax=Specibacter sp. AOP5-B1-6 TaxID=3457653 RepID=UPI003FB83539